MFAAFAIAGDFTMEKIMSHVLHNAALLSRMSRDALPRLCDERCVHGKGFLLTD